jgi:predicted dehydrogenase
MPRSVSRRRFLQTATAAVVAPTIIPGSALGLDSSIPPSERIIMGCIGVGGQGTRQMAGGIWSPEGGFIAQQQVQVVAVCDANRHNRENARNIVNQRYGNKDCAAYVDFRELLERSDISAILSATGDRWHSYVGMAAARAGKDVYSEKPVSVTIAEARALANTVRRYGVIFQIGTQQRSMRNFRFACELVRNGYLGDVKRVIGDLVPGFPPHCDLPAQPVPDWLNYDLWLGPAPWRPFNQGVVGGWMGWFDYSGGDMTNWGAHVMDIVQWGLGMDDSGPLEVIPPDGKEFKVLTYRYPKNVIAVIDRTPGMSKGIIFEGTKGTVRVSREVFETEPASLKKVTLGPTEIRLHESDNHHTDFLNSVRTRERNASDAEIACRSISVCHMGNIAIYLNRPLKWDARKEQFIDDAEANQMLHREPRAPWYL